MKELIKIVVKKLFILSIIVNTVYSLADYGEVFALSHFGTSPLTLDKIISLTISIFVLDIIMLIAGKVSSYIDNVNNMKVQTAIQKYLKDKTYVIVTHRPKLKKLCNRHYVFNNYIMQEMITV